MSEIAKLRKIVNSRACPTCGVVAGEVCTFVFNAPMRQSGKGWFVHVEREKASTFEAMMDAALGRIRES